MVGPQTLLLAGGLACRRHSAPVNEAASYYNKPNELYVLTFTTATTTSADHVMLFWGGAGSHLAAPCYSEVIRGHVEEYSGGHL